MNENIDEKLPAITIEAEPRYVAGFPMLVAVTLRNTAADTDYLNLPALGLAYPLDSIAMELEPADGGQAVRAGPQFTWRDRNLFKLQLMSRESMRSVIDLSDFGQPVPPGRYGLKLLLYAHSKVFRASNVVRVEIVAPSDAERAEAERLRRMGLRDNMPDTGSWQPFLTRNPQTVTVGPEVQGPALDQLRLHLVLHRAAYDPEPLANFPVARLREIRGVAAAEAQILEYEMLTMREGRDGAEALRARLLASAPELGKRLRQIEAGEGLLRTLRMGYGAERKLQRPPGTTPYVTPQ
jgi:hypothetical protein